MSDPTYRCCKHCYRDVAGKCTGAPYGTDTHEVPCDVGGPHADCPSCCCDPCGGTLRVVPETS